MLALMVLFHGQGFVRWVIPGFYILTLEFFPLWELSYFSLWSFTVCLLWRVRLSPSHPLGQVVYFPTGQEIGLQAEPGRKHLPE